MTTVPSRGCRVQCHLRPRACGPYRVSTLLRVRTSLDLRPFAALSCLAAGCAWPAGPPPAAGRAPVDLQAAPAAAETAAAGPGFALLPYFWAAGIEGDVRVGPTPAPVSAEFDDLVENLEGGLMLAAEARFERGFGALADLTWMDLAQEAAGPPGFATVRGTNELIHGQLCMTYRPPGQQGVLFDVLGGVRLIDVECSLQADATRASAGETLFDPVIGVRATVPVGESLRLLAHADAGGYRLGSDLSYQLLATVAWQPSRSFAFGIGWRHLGLDFDEPDLAMDVVFSGPLVGMHIGF